MPKLRWGVLSTADIAEQRLIPAMQASAYCELLGVASRSAEKARAFADKLAIPLAFDSYEALLASDKIDAVYNPLPNHLHVPFTIKAIEAGKHVLCEKPIALNSVQAQELLEVCAEHPQIKVMEAFMYRFHPQWQHVLSLIGEGALGTVRSIDSNFTFFNQDPDNVRNQTGVGGGALMDVGCYCISVARSVYGRQPRRVLALSTVDAQFGIDHSTKGLLDFGDGIASFFCSMQSTPSQAVNIIGEKASLSLTTPFYRQDTPTSIQIQDADGSNTLVFEHCDHYQAQVDAFSQAVIKDQPVPTPLRDALENMQVIDALARSAEQGSWYTLS